MGIREIVIVPTSGSAVSLPAGRELGFNLQMVSATLRGNDVIKSVNTQVEAVEWSLENGGISLEALAALTGETLDTTGVTPNRVTTFSVAGGDNMPYVKIYGKALGDGIDDLHVKLFKAKITSLEGSLKNGEYYITKCSGIAVHDDVNGIIDIVENETATALPTS
jgi:hypothetical protein